MTLGNAAGIGIVVDAGGNDRYVVLSDVTLGYANDPGGLRANMLTAGLFLDAGGTDLYSQTYAADNTCWSIGPGRSLMVPTMYRCALGADMELTANMLEDLWRRR